MPGGRLVCLCPSVFDFNERNKLRYVIACVRIALRYGFIISIGPHLGDLRISTILRSYCTLDTRHPYKRSANQILYIGVYVLQSENMDVICYNFTALELSVVNRRTPHEPSPKRCYPPISSWLGHFAKIHCSLEIREVYGTPISIIS